MSKYVIHACEDRRWYVEDYLIPSMTAQGIDRNNITIFMDSNKRGNLFACMDCFKSMPDDDGSTWHLQDDILIASTFKQKTEELEDAAPLVCGFCFRVPAYIAPEGLQPPQTMWYSFQCIKIPNKVARECADWFFKTAQYDTKYHDFIRANKGDDSMFKIFIEQKFGTDKIALNLKPSIVEHIDDLIGGSLINQLRKMDGPARGVYFEEPEKVELLTAALANRNKKAVVYAGTRNLYHKMLPPIRSLLLNSSVDKIYLLIEDDKFPYPLPPEVETINVSGQSYFRSDGPNMKNPWGYMVLLRAAYWDLFPQWNKILSLDVDTIVVDDIDKLWDIDIENYYVAGVREPLKSRGGQQCRSPLYVNFGVAMYNLKALRDGTGAEMIQKLDNFHYDFSEQDAFNIYCSGKIKELPPEYNDTRYWTSFHITPPTAHPRIIHYAAVKDYAKYDEYKKYDGLVLVDEEGSVY